MSAPETAHQDFCRTALSLPRLHRKETFYPCPSRTAGQEDAFLLRIQIDHAAALQHGQVDAPGAVHAHFLVHGDDHFQTGMFYGFCVKKRQGICHRNAVIPAQAGALCRDFVSLHQNLKPLRPHVNVTVRLLHCHHVHMSLQNHGGFLFITGSRFLYHDNILPFILNAEKSPFLRKLRQIIADLPHIPRPVGNLRNLLKKIKYTLWFQVCQYAHLISAPFIHCQAIHLFPRATSQVAASLYFNRFQMCCIYFFEKFTRNFLFLSFSVS